MRNRTYFLWFVTASALLTACASFNTDSSKLADDHSEIVSQITSHCTDLDAPELGDGKLCIDNGFTIVTDNFSFANWGRSTEADSNVTIQTFIDLFGHSAVCLDGPKTECVMRPQTKQKLEEWNNALAGGRCEGLATLSTRFFLHLDDPLIFNNQANRVSDLRQRNLLLDSAIVYWWATQFLTEVSDRAASSRTRSPLQLVDDLIQGLANGVGYTVGLYDKSSGHAVTPFAVTHRGTDFVIHVYDNNFPGMRKEIVVDGVENTWTYNAARSGPDGIGIDWHGGVGSLELTPMSSRQGPFECSFCSSSPIGGDTVLTIASRDATAAGYVLVTTRDGRRIEATPLGVTNTISGARYEVSKGAGGGLVTIRVPHSIIDFDLEVRKASSVIPAADVVIAIQRPEMATIQVSGNLAHTVVGTKQKSSTLLAVRAESISVSAPAQNSARISIAAGNQLSRTELASGKMLLVDHIADNAIEVAIKGNNGSPIGSTFLDATETRTAIEANLSLDENGKITTTNARVEPIPVDEATLANFRPGAKKPPSTTTTTSTANPTSIEIALPG